MALILLGVYVLRAGLRFIRNHVAHVAGWGVVADARHDIYEHLQRLSLGFYEDQQSGELMSRMINDSDKFKRLIEHAIPNTPVNVLMFFGAMGILLSMN